MPRSPPGWCRTVSTCRIRRPTSRSTSSTGSRSSPRTRRRSWAQPPPVPGWHRWSGRLVFGHERGVRRAVLQREPGGDVRDGRFQERGSRATCSCSTTRPISSAAPCTAPDPCERSPRDPGRSEHGGGVPHQPVQRHRGQPRRRGRVGNAWTDWNPSQLRPDFPPNPGPLTTAQGEFYLGSVHQSHVSAGAGQRVDDLQQQRRFVSQPR